MPGRVEESHGKRERVKNSHTSASANELCRSTPHASNHSPFCCSFFSRPTPFFPPSTALPRSQIYDLETTVVRDCQPLPSTHISPPAFLSFIFSCSFCLYFIRPPSMLENYSHFCLLKWYLFGLCNVNTVCVCVCSVKVAKKG